ncbi:MAG TPA: trypsin-like peptidase domain-containing protein [Thermomicrobiales bacterium]|nr:trypsin-like peptidase domain-containing protein [Thermomicrobiales bacterium]
MRPVLAALLMLLVLTGLFAPATARQEADDGVEQARGSVVTVYTYHPGGPFSRGQTGRAPSGAGSGWVYDEGLVVTNAHVVDGAEEITVVTTAGELIPAKVVGSDWYQDVAVLRLNPDDPDDLPPSLPIGDSREVEAGEPVVAIGTPHGQFADTVSEGEVLAVDQRINTGQGYSMLNLIRHSALLAPGNSGGPLVNVAGDVIGMNVASRRSSDDDMQQPPTGFAIASDAFVSLVEEIVETGTVARPWLGVTTRLVDGETVVHEVERGSPAAKAGVEEGDRIVAVDGQSVTWAVPFIDLLYQHDQGDEIVLTVERDGAELEVPVGLDRR